MKTTPTTTTRPTSAIAHEIRASWANVNFAARPYLNAMAYLDTLRDSYGYDDARGIVLRFLSNSSSWRGDDARALKSELRSMLSAVR